MSGKSEGKKDGETGGEGQTWRKKGKERGRAIPQGQKVEKCHQQGQGGSKIPFEARICKPVDPTTATDRG